MTLAPWLRPSLLFRSVRVVGTVLSACVVAVACGASVGQSPGDPAIDASPPPTDGTLDASTRDSAALLDGTSASIDSATFVDGPEPSDASDARAAVDADIDAAVEPICQRPATDVGIRSDACLAWLDLGAKKLPYYRSHALGQNHNQIENVVVIQHGNSRNGWDYYDLVAAGAVLRDPIHTAVIAPLFQAYNSTCGFDAKGADDLYWGCSDWKQGFAAKNATIDSYAALDALIAAAKASFPGLKRVTIAGYSAGGQTIQRYAAGNVEHDRTPTITTRYVVGSPGSYMYLDGQRVKSDAVCTSATNCALDANSFEVPAYAPGCETSEPAVEPGGSAYDEYRYGLVARTGYLAAIPDATLRAKYLGRSVVYVLSAGDSTSGPRTAYSVLDKECAAFVQAPFGSSFRLQRGLVYHRYVTTLGAAHRLRVVPVCAHEEDCVLADPGMKDELFAP